MALIARYLIDTSAAARMPQPVVAERLAPLIRSGLVATCASLDAEALHSARGSDDYDRIRASRRRTYEYLPLNDDHWARAVDAQSVLARSGRHRGVGIADLLTAVIAEQHRLTLIHYDSDFDIAADVVDFEGSWVVPRGSIP